MAFNFRLLTDILVGGPITAYDDVGAHNKQIFHRDARRFLRALAAQLGLEKNDYDLRSNEGGIAVSGEVTLHADRLYIQLSKGAFADVLFRRCESRQDYYGRANHSANLADLKNPTAFPVFLASCKQLLRTDFLLTPLAFVWKGFNVRPQFGLHARSGISALCAIADGDQWVGRSPVPDGQHIDQLSLNTPTFPPQTLGNDVIGITQQIFERGVVSRLSDAGIIEPDVLATSGEGRTMIYAYRLTPAAQRLRDAHLAAFQRAAA